MMMLYRAHSIAAVRKLGGPFFNQGRFFRLSCSPTISRTFGSVSILPMLLPSG